MRIENAKIVGIDPGKSGGIAYVNASDVIVAEPFGKTEGDILSQLRAVIAPKTKVYLEQVGGYAGRSLPGSAMFNFGRNEGGKNKGQMETAFEGTRSTFISRFINYISFNK